MLAPMLVFALMIGIWLAISYVLLEPRRRFLMPPPQDVVRVGLLDPRNFSEILGALWSTTQVAIVGLAVAVAVGTLVPVAMIQARWIEWSIYPWAVVLQTIPILAIVPLIGFWFQFGFSSRVLVCVLISLFPIITNTLFGLKSSDQAHHDLFTLQRASRIQRLLKLQLPGALPAIVSGWRIAAGLSVVGAIVGDFFFRQGDPGIGRLIDDYRARLQSEQLFAAVALSSLLGLVVFWGFGLLGTLLVGSWHESHRTAE
ncbi:MAG: ABC transporter permease [Chloroflexi bacterium]|nr:MAG: ABC transporter permease [Chloroflexota bacterium]